jgi:hypothetical protein
VTVAVEDDRRENAQKRRRGAKPCLGVARLVPDHGGRVEVERADAVRDDAFLELVDRSIPLDDGRELRVRVDARVIACDRPELGRPLVEDALAGHLFPDCDEAATDLVEGRAREVDRVDGAGRNSDDGVGIVPDGQKFADHPGLGRTVKATTREHEDARGSAVDRTLETSLTPPVEVTWWSWSFGRHLLVTSLFAREESSECCWWHSPSEIP